MISLVVASERERAQTLHLAIHVRGCRTALSYDTSEQKSLESLTIAGDSPVSEA